MAACNPASTQDLGQLRLGPIARHGPHPANVSAKWISWPNGLIPTPIHQMPWPNTRPSPPLASEPGCITPRDGTASDTDQPCDTSTSTCWSLATISSGICIFRAIPASSEWIESHPPRKDHPFVGAMPARAARGMPWGPPVAWLNDPLGRCLDRSLNPSVIDEQTLHSKNMDLTPRNDSQYAPYKAPLAPSASRRSPAELLWGRSRNASLATCVFCEAGARPQAATLDYRGISARRPRKVPSTISPAPRSAAGVAGSERTAHASAKPNRGSVPMRRPTRVGLVRRTAAFCT